MSVSHDELKALLLQALEATTPERRAAMLAACPNPALADEARSLLGLELEASRLDPRAVRPLRPEVAESTLPERIGPYRIEGALGSGGMGSVYRGVRDDGSFRKEVAIKVVRDLHSPELRQRFARERELLARLEHPGIARVLDGGMTEFGQPWMAIERVDGLALHHYVASRQASLRERIELLLAVLDAVQFAHQNLIVHRDLKPSNVLVTHGGQVKLIDFGIAKLLAAGDETKTHSRAPMTYAYAAPEQIKGGQITTATDVYALGVMLYELLTGERPHKAQGESALSLLQAVTDTDATAPSAVVGKLAGTTGDGIAASQIRGDLDTICLKALSREPQRRYHSAQAFAEDLRAYLEHRPISARRDRGSYRLGKWVRRNPGLAASLTLLLLSIAAGAGFSLNYARQAQLEAKRSQSQLRATDALSQVLTGMFADASPYRNAREGITVANLLRLAEQRASLELQLEPALQHTVRSDLALAVHYAVDSEQGLQQLKQVWEQAERDPSLPSDVRLTLLLNLIDGYDNAAKTGEAAALRSVLEQFEPAPQIGTLLWYRRQSALLENNNFDPASIEAIRAFAAEAASFRASWGWQAEELLARYLRRAERFAEAAPIHDRLIEHHRKTGVRMNLAAVLRTSVFKAPATPEKLARLGEALEIMVSELGAGHPETLLTRMNLVEARLQSGELEGVDAEFVELIDQQRHFQSEVSVATMANYVRYLIDRRDFKRAAPFAVEALALAPKLNLNPDAPMSLAPRLYAAQVDLGRGDVAAVNAVLPGLLNDAKNAPAAFWRMLLLSADTRHRMGDHKQALVVAEQAKAAFPARPANAPPSAHLGRIHALLGEIHVALGELELAKANLEQALAIDQQAPEAWCVWPARAQLVLAKLLAQDPSHLQRAAQLRAAGETRMAKLTQPDDPWRTDLRSP